MEESTTCVLPNARSRRRRRRRHRASKKAPGSASTGCTTPSKSRKTKTGCTSKKIWVSVRFGFFNVSVMCKTTGSAAKQLTANWHCKQRHGWLRVRWSDRWSERSVRLAALWLTLHGQLCPTDWTVLHGFSVHAQWLNHNLYPITSFYLSHDIRESCTNIYIFICVFIRCSWGSIMSHEGCSYIQWLIIASKLTEASLTGHF